MPMTFCIPQAGTVGISHDTGYFSTRHPGNKSFCCSAVFRIMGKRNWISERRRRRRRWSSSFICPRDTGAFSDQTGRSYGTNIPPSIAGQCFSTYIDKFWCSGAITSPILGASTIFRSSKYFFSIFLNCLTLQVIVYSHRTLYIIHGGVCFQVLASNNDRNRLLKIFGALNSGLTSYDERRWLHKIDYWSLKDGNPAEVRFVLGKVIMDTMSDKSPSESAEDALLFGGSCWWKPARPPSSTLFQSLKHLRSQPSLWRN